MIPKTLIEHTQKPLNALWPRGGPWLPARSPGTGPLSLWAPQGLHSCRQACSVWERSHSWSLQSPGCPAAESGPNLDKVLCCGVFLLALCPQEKWIFLQLFILPCPPAHTNLPRRLETAASETSPVFVKVQWEVHTPGGEGLREATPQRYAQFFGKKDKEPSMVENGNGSPGPVPPTLGRVDSQCQCHLSCIYLMLVLASLKR